MTTESANTTAPVNVTESVNTTAPVNVTESANTTAPVNATESVNTTAPVNVTESANTTAPVNVTESVNTTAPVKVFEDLSDSGTVNTNNVAVLRKMEADKLQDVSTETIAAFTKTVAHNPIDMSDNLDKVLDSYKQIETATELGIDDLESAENCIVYGVCN
jgi:hypothetical protein